VPASAQHGRLPPASGGRMAASTLAAQAELASPHLLRGRAFRPHAFYDFSVLSSHGLWEC
jgi:hypothetical protein